MYLCGGEIMIFIIERGGGDELFKVFVIWFDMMNIV